MTNPYNFVNIFLSFLLLIFLVLLIIKLFKRMRETKLSNIKWLILSLAATSLVGFVKMGTIIFPPIDILFNIIEFIVVVSLILFTKETFYQERQSSFKYVAVVAIGLSISSIFIGIFRIIMNDTLLYLLELYLLSQTIVIASIWHSSASFTSLNIIKNENIDKNIKLRYILIGLSALFLAIQGFLIPIHGILRSFLGDYDIVGLYSMINVILSLGFAFNQFYAWIILGMKIEKTKVIINIEDDISEEELMRMINPNKF